MRTIESTCPRCHKVNTVGEELIGRYTPCGNCRALFQRRDKQDLVRTALKVNGSRLIKRLALNVRSVPRREQRQILDLVTLKA